jgi:hypothetical protein
MLSRTNLKDANLVNANISDARFEDTYLKGADLSGVIGLTREMLDAALLDHCTKLPPEFEHLIPQPGADKKSIWDGPPVDIP